MKKRDKIEEIKAAESEADQLKDLLSAVNDTQPLPASGTELILLEVDPHRAHAYWNIDPAQAQSGLPLVLRTYDITDSGSAAGAGQAFDVEVQGLQGRWYLDFWRDDRTFVSEIGYRNPDGSIRVIARSNEVQTPPAGPVDEETTGNHTDLNGKPLLTEWPGDKAPEEVAEEAVAEDGTVDVEPPAEKSAEQPAVDVSDDKADTEPAVVEEPVTILDDGFPVPEWDKISVAGIVPSAEERDDRSGEDAVMAAGDASVAFENEIMNGGTEEEADEGQDDASGDEPPSEPGEPFPSAEELAASITENHVALHAFYEAAGPDTGHVEDYSREPSPNDGDGVPAETAPEGPAELPPLEQIVGLSSMENAHKDVLLEVNAELHIYGRSKPNTELTLYGQVVKTRPDGTFSVRRILPHGAVVLPLLYSKKDT